MAFIFVPNADGSFTEGDKQTNPDTGIEYIYSDGAWRVLGPKIEDQFDELDERYLQIENTDEFATKEDLENIDISGYLPLSGGKLTGTLNTQLVKSTRNTGYAFEVKPDDGDTVALIRTAGTAKFKGLLIDSLLASASERPFEIKGRLSDGSTVSKNFFYVYANADGTASAINYDGKMDVDKNIVNKSFVDNKVPGRFTFESGALYYNT